MFENSRSWYAAPVLVLGLAVFGWPQGAAVADTTQDCGRFYLKFNKKTDEMECVNVYTGKTKVKARIRARLREVDLALREADRILGQDRVTDEDRERVNDLLASASAAVEDIRQRSQQLSQQQQSFRRRIINEEIQRIRQTQQLARQIVRQQRAAVRQLRAEQRARRNQLAGL